MGKKRIRMRDAKTANFAVEEAIRSGVPASEVKKTGLMGNEVEFSDRYIERMDGVAKRSLARAEQERGKGFGHHVKKTLQAEPDEDEEEEEDADAYDENWDKD